MLTESHSSGQQCCNCGRTQATKHSKLYARASRESTNDNKLSAKVKGARDQEDSNEKRNDRSSDTQLASESGIDDDAQPIAKQRRRDRVRSVLRKMVPGAGIAVGTAVLVERILEIVVNVS